MNNRPAVKIERHDGYPIGIDFGTTNSVMCRYMNTRLCTGPNEFNFPRTGDVLYPSFLFLDEKQNKVLTGMAAYNQRFRSSEKVVRSIKRSIASSKKYTLCEREYSSSVLASHIIADLIAEVKLAEPLLKSVILVATVPYYFGENENYKIREAVKLAVERELNGNCSVILLPEPVAAALSCIYALKDKAINDKVFLICDIGGGTLDLTLVKISNTKTDISFEVLGSEGVACFGGDDIDALLYDYIISRQRIDLSVFLEREMRQDKARMMDEVVDLKHQLTCIEEATFVCSGLHCAPNGLLEMSLTRKCLEGLICGESGSSRNMLKELDDCLNRLLVKTQLKQQDVNILIPIGGTSLIPLFREYLTNRFEQALIYKEDNNQGRFVNVARGASVYAALKSDELYNTSFHPFGQGKNIGRFIVRISHSLYIEKFNGELDLIISGNTISPSKVEKVYFPTCYKQDNEKVELNSVQFYQSKDGLAKDYEYIGSLDFSDYSIYTHGRNFREIPIKLSFVATDVLVETNCEIARGNQDGTDLRFTQIIHY